MTNTLNPSLALMVYQTRNGEHDAMCFVGDLDRDVTEQAQDYMRHEDIDGKLIRAYWHNALEDVYGNRYEPEVKQVG